MPGIRISEHLPKLAQQHGALGDHSLDEHQGRGPHPGDLFPADRLFAERADPISGAGRALGKEMGVDGAELPNFVSISPLTGLSPQPIRPVFSARAMLRWSSARRVKRN